MAINITKQNFVKEVMESDVPVLLDFWANWCGPCRMLSPIIEELSAELKDKKICKVDVDQEPSLANEFNVSSIPTLIVVHGGKVVDRAVGVRTKADIIKMLDR